MPGLLGKSGRRPKPGKLYRFWLRFRPGIDPPELQVLLDSIEAASGEKKAAILRSALLGGAQQAATEAAAVEDTETADLIDDLFSEF
jgi:hypothetical protein